MCGVFSNALASPRLGNKQEGTPENNPSALTRVSQANSQREEDSRGELILQVQLRPTMKTNVCLLLYRTALHVPYFPAVGWDVVNHPGEIFSESWEGRGGAPLLSLPMEQDNRATQREILLYLTEIAFGRQQHLPSIFVARVALYRGRPVKI